MGFPFLFCPWITISARITRGPALSSAGSRAPPSGGHQADVDPGLHVSIILATKMLAGIVVRGAGQAKSPDYVANSDDAAETKSIGEPAVHQKGGADPLKMTDFSLFN